MINGTEIKCRLCTSNFRYVTMLLDDRKENIQMKKRKLQKEGISLKIQFLNGGLANQVFQYIFARYYELSHPGEYMYMDDSYFAIHTVHNGYELEKVFGIRPHMLSECFDKPVWDAILEGRKSGKSVPQIFRENQIPIQMITEVGNYAHFNPFDGEVFPIPNNGYYPEILDVPGNIYYHGYWINKNWFAEYQNLFLKEFVFPEITDGKNRSYLRQIRESDSVSVHIRRGDYVTLGWNLDTAAYRTGMKTFAKQAPGTWHLFVFSDDIDWCRAHEQELGFGSFAEITYIEGNVRGKNYLDLQLMTNCQAMILSNSAFCYLAALLNPERRYTLNLSDRKL